MNTNRPNENNGLAPAVSSHTPGPWIVSDRADLFRIREEASDAVLATTDDGGHPDEEIFDRETQRANARLIAAAPDLYEAAAKAAKVFRGYAELHRAKNTEEADAKAVVNDVLAEEMEAALLKANGNG